MTTCQIDSRTVKDRYRIICDDMPNHPVFRCCGKAADGTSIEDVIDKWNLRNEICKIEFIYCFDWYKEMIRWFAE